MIRVERGAQLVEQPAGPPGLLGQVARVDPDRAQLEVRPTSTAWRMPASVSKVSTSKVVPGPSAATWAANASRSSR